MKIQALQGLRGNYGRARRGDVLDVSDDVAKSLVSRGLAHQVGVRMDGVAPANRAAQSPLAGGRTGGGASASSSHPVKARRGSTSSSRGAAQSVPASTKAGGSPRGPASSTPATEPGGTTAPASPSSAA